MLGEPVQPPPLEISHWQECGQEDRTFSPPPHHTTPILLICPRCGYQCVCVCVSLRQSQRRTCTGYKGRQMSTGNTTPVGSRKK